MSDDLEVRVDKLERAVVVLCEALISRSKRKIEQLGKETDSPPSIQHPEASMSSPQAPTPDTPRDWWTQDATPDVEELRAVAFDLAQRMQAVKEASRDGRFGYGLRWAHESNLGGCDAVDRFIKVALAPTSDKTKGGAG